MQKYKKIITKSKKIMYLKEWKKKLFILWSKNKKN